MTTNTDPVRALIAKWQAAPYGKGDHDYYVDGLRACARELESALASAPPAEAQAQCGGEVAWRVPVLQSPFGERLDHGVRDELVLVMHRGAHGWKAAGHALLAHQLYVKNVRPLCAASHEVAVVGLSGGGWRTVWARSDDDVTHPAPPSAPVGVEVGLLRWVKAQADDPDANPRFRELYSALAQQPAAPTLAKHQPCGCVICTCEDEQQCQGCGAKHCGNRADHPPYVVQQPAAPSGEAVLGALKDVCAMHLLMLAADDREGATQMVGDHNMRAAAWRLRSDCVLPQEQAKDKIMEKLSSALALAFGDWGLE